MLDIERFDVSDLCMALEDNAPEHSWWLEPRTGELEFWSEYGENDESQHPEERALLYVEPVDSHEAYGDMEDFVETVGDERARDLLLRALAGRAAFRRFKDTLFEFPELREAWFRLHDARMERRAIRWLERQGLISAEAAERALDARAEPEQRILDRGASNAARSASRPSQQAQDRNSTRTSSLR